MKNNLQPRSGRARSSARAGNLPAASFSDRRANVESGMATVIFVALMAIMLLLVLAEASAVVHLSREEKLLETNQMKRLAATQTNNLPATVIRP